VVVAAIVAVADIRHAIGFSSFAVLTYYAIANASAFTLDARERRWPRWLAASGVVGCALLAFSLPLAAVIAGSVLLLAGAGVFALRSRRTAPAHVPPGA
jgi:APA family basic amino acid/polyamine antiporter